MYFNHKNVFFLFLSLIAIGSGACGGKDPLTDAQKQEVRDIHQDAGRSFNASVAKARKAQQLGAVSSPVEYFASILGRSHYPLATAGGGFDDAKSRKYRSILQDATCEVEVPKQGGGSIPTSDNDEDDFDDESDDFGLHAFRSLFAIPSQSFQALKNIKIAVGGSQCPIKFNAHFNMDVNAGGPNPSMEGALGLDFKISEDSDLAGIAEVSAALFEAEFSVSQGSGNLKGGGSFTTKDRGVIQTTISGGGSGGSDSAEFNAAYSMKFQDFEAVFEIKGQSSGGEVSELTYLVNDQEVSKEEFASYFGDIAGNAPQAPAIASQLKM